MSEDLEQPGEIKSFSTPRLNPEEKLYVRVYLHTLSHAKAYESVRPGLKSYASYNSSNQFKNRESVQYYISQGLQEKAEAISLSSEVILERLYKEAVREGPGSNHAARIQALNLLGKHFGLFEEKKEENNHTFNIINYSTPTTQAEPLSLPDKEGKKLEDEEVLPDKVVLTNFLKETDEYTD